MNGYPRQPQSTSKGGWKPAKGTSQYIIQARLPSGAKARQDD